MNGGPARLVDDTGATVHTWPGTNRTGVSAYLRANGNLVRAIWGNASELGGIQEVALDGRIVWDWRYDRPGTQVHHDIELMPNGNVLFIAWEDKTLAEALAAGRNPALVAGVFQPDHVVEVRPTGPTSGEIVWEWHVWDHLIQDFDARKANYGNVAAHRELIDINYPPTPIPPSEPTPRAPPPPPPLDYNHTNSVSYDPVNDWVILSPRAQCEVWIIDHGTTTAEAAGHTGGRYGKGGDLLYRWGNPQAYRRGTEADQKLFLQHSAKRIPPGYPGAGNLTVFNNQVSPRSEVWELVLPLDSAGNFVVNANGTYGPDGPVWRYGDATFHSALMSSCERLPNGNTLICSSLQSRVFEVTPARQKVWQVSSGVTFNATYVERALWASATEVSAANGGTVGFDLIPGRRHAGRNYVLAGSMSGTSPGFQFGGAAIPLNLDAYLMGTLGSSLLPDSIGVVGTDGRATAAFALPPRLADHLAGTRLHHAFLVLDASTLAVTRVSNAEPLLLR